jgi:alkylated DNA repair dioxygenase AlkB
MSDQLHVLDMPTIAPTGCDVRYAITFGEVAILHVGSKEYGSGRRANGYSVQELHQIAENLNRIHSPDIAKVISVSSALPDHLKDSSTDAAVLVIRRGAHIIGGICADSLLAEQRGVDYDKQFYDNRRKKTLHKRARYNIVFSSSTDTDIPHSEDYCQCSIASFNSLPNLSQFREGLVETLGETHASNLEAEGNCYYNKTSGIGFHGDSERKVVICLSLGKPTVLRYHWRLPGSSEHTLQPIDINIGHGDVYVMSEKATGYDWRMRSKVRVVHAAGSSKYTARK